jgi:hypothetical protein
MKIFRLLQQHITISAFIDAVFSRRVAVGLGLALPVLLVIAMMGIRGPSVGVYTRDLVVQANLSPFVGFLSTLGFLVWAGSIGIWYCVRIVAVRRGNNQLRSLATASMLLTLWLLLDDCFLLHEEVVPTYLHIREKLVLLGIAIAGLAYGFWFREMLIPYAFPLSFAFLPLAASLMMDTVAAGISWTLAGSWQYYYEDAAKWIGIVGWAGFAILMFRDELERSLSSGDSAQDVLVDDSSSATVPSAAPATSQPQPA